MKDHAMPAGASQRRGAIVSWIANVLAAAYFARMSFHFCRSSRYFAEIFQGLGADLPGGAAFLIQHRYWFYPLVFGGFAFLVFSKESLLRDKRLSTMITFALVILGHFVGRWITYVYYRPLLGQLAG